MMLGESIFGVFISDDDRIMVSTNSQAASSQTHAACNTLTAHADLLRSTFDHAAKVNKKGFPQLPTGITYQGEFEAWYECYTGEMQAIVRNFAVTRMDAVVRDFADFAVQYLGGKLTKPALEMKRVLDTTEFQLSTGTLTDIGFAHIKP